jgi:hypothetical protein
MQRVERGGKRNLAGLTREEQAGKGGKRQIAGHELVDPSALPPGPNIRNPGS